MIMSSQALVMRLGCYEEIAAEIAACLKTTGM